MFKKFGIEPLIALGKNSTPSRHEALGFEETEESEDGTVTKEVQKGYMFRERLLRPSLVIVAKNPSAPLRQRRRLRRPMSDKDYYRILGVNRDADDADIKKAYRKLAQEYHPDKHSGDKTVEEKFKTINEAYEVLKDPGKRAHYDRFGTAEARGPFAEGGFGPDFQDFFGDIFSDFFGGRHRQGPQSGDDLRYDLEIGFEESISGATKKVEVKKTVQCAACRGTRAKPGTSAATCPNCKGNGQVFMQQGFLRIARPCPNCRGEGRTIPHPCEECKGLGFMHAARALTINVPPGWTPALASE